MDSIEEKIELVRTIIEWYYNNVRDCMVIADHSGCTVPVKANREIPAPVGDEISNIEVIGLTYRMKYNNGPTLMDDGISCQLAFGGKFSLTFVPYHSILQIISDENPMNAVSFPYTLLEPIAKVSTIKPKLRVVK